MHQKFVSQHCSFVIESVIIETIELTMNFLVILVVFVSLGGVYSAPYETTPAVIDTHKHYSAEFATSHANT